MAEVKKKKWRWYAKITSREDALDAVKGSSTAFFVVGAIQVAVSFFLGFSILFDAAIYLIGGFLLHRFHSRAAAVVILVLAAFSLYVTVANRLGENLGGGSNILLSDRLLGRDPGSRSDIQIEESVCFGSAAR